MYLGFFLFILRDNAKFNKYDGLHFYIICYYFHR